MYIQESVTPLIARNTGTKRFALARFLQFHQKRKETFMIHLALTFLIVALIAGVLGLTGIAGISAQIAWILFIVGLVLALISFLIGRRPV
jgi:uncharacterized membrane protein YtjA (UPF0391 family)